jgi:hypothetical protein
LKLRILILDFEFDQHLGSHKHVINIIMWFIDMGCYRHHAIFSFYLEHPQNWKTTCYLTKPTHISHVLCAIHMVTRSTNRSLESLAGTTTIQNST